MSQPIYRCALAASVALLLGIGHPGTAHAKSYTIEANKSAVTKLGPFKTRNTAHYRPTLARAIRAFGRPSSRFQRHGGCIARWKRLGLRIDFYNFGGSSLAPCDPGFGYAQSVAMKRSRKWRTWKGLRIGMSEEQLLDRHPLAEWVEDHDYYPDGWWLRQNYSPFGDGAYYPVVSAQVGGRFRVKRFEGWIGAAGE